MWYLKSAFDAYQNVQSSLQTRFSELQSAALSPIQAVKSFLGSPGAEKNEKTEELLELRRRLTELEAQQEKPKSKRKTSEKKSSAKKRTANVTRRLHDDR